MRLLPTLFSILFVVATAAGPLGAQPPAGSQLDVEDNGCALCHGEARLWQGDQLRLFVPHSGLAQDVHWRKGVNCHDCHGGDPQALDIAQAHALEVADGSTVLPFRRLPEGVRAACSVCHKDKALALRKSVHAHAQRDKESDPGKLLDCGKCHGDKAHGMLPVSDERSPIYLDHQVRTCGACHEGDLKTYKETVHGKGLFESGLVITATCADCHGAHGIYYAADERSTLHDTNVAATCGACHREIGDRLQKSVHGRKPGQPVEELKSGSKWKRNPTCTDCHQGHHLLKPKSTAYRASVVNLCGNCHPELAGRYAMSTHGELTELGYTSAAECSDCHGAHDILSLDDPAGRLAPGENRLATCRQCHIHAVANFSQFDPHADHKDAVHYPMLSAVYTWTHTLFLLFLLFFIIHAFLWFLRSFIPVLQGGGHRTLVTGQYAVVRFTRLNRVIYLALLVSFLGLTVTGLPLKYSTQKWAHLFVQGLGGFESTSVWHHFFGTTAILCCVAHVLNGFKSIGDRRKRGMKWREILVGPDSPVLSLRDFRDLFSMARWFVGLGPKPRFERWTYWEKFDYWMAFLACVMVGTSGLMMWYPNLFCRFVSGEMLNVARVIHVELAVLASSFLFVFHFFHTHFRPEKFPIDVSALTGLVSEDHLREHRPAYVARLEESGRLDEMRRAAPSRRRLWSVFLAGAVLFSLGLFVLAVALAASLGK